MSKLRVGRSIGHGGAQGDRAALDGPPTLSSTGPVTGHVLAPLVTGMEVKPVGRTPRFFHWYTERAFLVAVAVLGALFIGGPANAAPRAALQVTDFIAPAATNTTLTTSPVSQAVQGTLVTLTAKVTGAAPQAPVGTVQFKDGPDKLGSPVQVVSSTGTAVGTISQLTVGQHQLSAVFTPSDSTAFTTSTSQTVPFMVIASSTGPAPTKTVLATSPSSTVAQGTVIATITPSTAVGTVQFKDGTTDVGAPVTVSNNGTASGSTSLLAPGSHSVTAVFTPTDRAAFSPSTSPALTYVITNSTTPTTVLDGEGKLDGRTTVLDGEGKLDVGTTVLDGEGKHDGGAPTPNAPPPIGSSPTGPPSAPRETPSP
jgi:Bacterial Ig-like domain (group 3)